MRTAPPMQLRHPFLAGLSDGQVAEILAYASPAIFPVDTLLFRVGDPADRFYVLTEGRVAIEIGAPGPPNMTLHILQAGDMLGWAWFYPPYRRLFDARTLTPVRAVAFDAAAIRALCEQDQILGYALGSLVTRVLLEGIQAGHRQLRAMQGSAEPVDIGTRFAR